MKAATKKKGKSGRYGNKPKTRKELRKHKRQQKKINKKNFFDKKKNVQNNTQLETKKSPSLKRNKVKHIDNDEEITSDFEMDAQDVPRRAGIKVEDPTDRFRQERLKEQKQQKELQKSTKKRRIEQLQMENEEEDKIIKTLEKRLKIDKRKTDKSIPKCFDDGFDYVLEMCLPENIEKMYNAAKEAADLQDSDDDFKEDLNIATGQAISGTKKKELSKNKSLKVDKVEKRDNNFIKMENLRKIESKYFGDDSDEDNFHSEDPELEQDSGSEVDELPIRSTNKKKKKQNNEIIRKIESESEDMSDNSFDDEDYLSEEKEDETRHKKASKNSKKSDTNVIENEEENGSNVDDDDDEISENDDGDESSKNDSNDEMAQNNIERADWEDIYGRKRDKEGNVVASPTEKYVPPHMRSQQSTDYDDDPKRKEKLLRLRRQLKGWLNRLAETNMHKIANDIDQLYMQNSRHDMNDTLTNLILDALVGNVLAPERMVLEHAQLIAVLHGNVGSEVGAHFLQALITKFDKLIQKIDEYDVENKELDNIIFILCHLYTFNIFQHSLIYEILQQLTSKLSEKSVECVLLILRSVGFVLRKDDPTTLKDFIADIQKKVNSAPDELKNNSRLKFMMDVLLAVKNNNVTKIPQYDPSVAEHLRKIMKTMLMNGKYVATLNITMEDLLKADERGKWWVVGSAWSGNIKNGETPGSGKQSNKFSKNQASQTFSAKILDLAKQQRMNTEDRKNVFCIIMSAEDYIDAFEKLLHLSIKDHRIIVSVLIHCCLAEKNYNPYYAVLAQKFCDFDRKYQLAIQYASWDKIKEIKTFTSAQITNFAQFLAYLIEQGGQPLSLLKIIEFAEIDKPTMRLVRQIMLSILLKDEDICKQIFARIAPSMKLNAFKDSIRLFLHHFLLKGASKSGIADEQIKTIKQRIQLADQALETADTKVQF